MRTLAAISAGIIVGLCIYPIAMVIAKELRDRFTDAVDTYEKYEIDGQ